MYWSDQPGGWAGQDCKRPFNCYTFFRSFFFFLLPFYTLWTSTPLSRAITCLVYAFFRLSVPLLLACRFVLVLFSNDLYRLCNPFSNQTSVLGPRLLILLISKLLFAHLVHALCAFHYLFIPPLFLLFIEFDCR